MSMLCGKFLQAWNIGNFFFPGICANLDMLGIYSALVSTGISTWRASSYVFILLEEFLLLKLIKSKPKYIVIC